jgi:hypothetical protein
VVKAGFSLQSVAFGMGGGLLQKVNRDTMSFATKLSHIHLTVRCPPPQPFTCRAPCRARRTGGRASLSHRPREDRLTHPADTSRSNLAAALALLPNPLALLAASSSPSLALVLQVHAQHRRIDALLVSWWGHAGAREGAGRDEGTQDRPQQVLAARHPPSAARRGGGATRVQVRLCRDLFPTYRGVRIQRDQGRVGVRIQVHCTTPSLQATLMCELS